MQYWGQVCAGLLKVPLFCGIPLDTRFDTVHVVGMYDAPFYQTTLEHTKNAKRRIIHWCGGDVMMLPQEAYKTIPDAVHTCQSDNLQRELWDKGVDATVIPFPSMTRYDVTPYPEKPAIGLYLGNDPDKYGFTVAKAAFDALGSEFDVDCYTYHFGEHPNGLADIINRCSVYLRLSPHDGSAISAREYLEAGRRVVCTSDIKYAHRVRHDDLVGVISALRKVLKETEPDHEAAAYWRAQNLPERWLKQMEGVL